MWLREGLHKRGGYHPALFGTSGIALVAQSDTHVGLVRQARRSSCSPDSTNRSDREMCTIAVSSVRSESAGNQQHSLRRRPLGGAHAAPPEAHPLWRILYRKQRSLPSASRKPNPSTVVAPRPRKTWRRDCLWNGSYPRARAMDTNARTTELHHGGCVAVRRTGLKQMMVDSQFGLCMTPTDV